MLKPALSFDDVLIEPAYSEVLPKDTNIQVKLSSNIQLNLPILSSAMDTVTEEEMAIAMASLGGLGVIHRNMIPEEQAQQVKNVKIASSINYSDFQPSLDSKGRLLVGAAIGSNVKDEDRLHKLIENEVDVIVVDTAHGMSKSVLDMVALVKKLYPNVYLIGGNVCTPEGVKRLADKGVDAVKIGVGPGSICTTRIVTGIGVPQFSAILETASIAKELGILSIADGGIRMSGDIAKAIGAGANMVMLGSLLAGTDKSPGEIFNYNNTSFKAYRGMGSIGAMAKGSSDRYFQGNVTVKEKFVSEGVEASVPYKGSIEQIIFQLAGGLRSAMGYTGSVDLLSMHNRCVFRQITNAGIQESNVHSVIMRGM